MAPVCRFIPSRGRAALLATAFLVSPAFCAGEAPAVEPPQIASHEGLAEANLLLKKGDEAYHEGRYAEAVGTYADARQRIPNAGQTRELWEAATERYVLASVEHGRELVRKGDLAGAKAAVAQALGEGADPHHPGALAFQSQLNDPIRTNQAMTAEHGKNVEAVRNLLYKAEGATALGNYDEARRTYESVLRIDPTNAAARRGMEQAAVAKDSYARAAHDQARATMLNDVEKAWEIQPPFVGEVPGSSLAAGLLGNFSKISVSNKIDRIILPNVALEQVTLEEAVDYLRAQAVRFDTFESDPSLRGVNFAVELGPEGDPAADAIRAKRFDLRLRNVPISQVLRYITETTQTTFATDEFSVIVRSVGQVTTELMSRSFRVPPDFLSTLGDVNAGGTTETFDPFAEQPASEGLLAKRRDIRSALEAKGVSFPEGSSVVLSPVSNVLTVRNTSANVDIIAQLVEAASQAEPVQVVITATILKVEENRIDELGFDWLLTNFGMQGGKFNLTGGTQGSGGDLTDIPLASGGAYNPITAGNRSGDEAVVPDGIDDLLARQQGFSPISRAPGVLSLTGFLNNSSYQGVMRGLAQKKGVDMMTAPSVVTRNGQSATVRIVREFIYPTEYEPPELPNTTGISSDDLEESGGLAPLGGFGVQAIPVVPAMPTAFETRDVGVALEVLPTVVADKGYIDLQINPVITSLDGFVNYGSPIQAAALSELGTPTVNVLSENAILMPVFSVTRLKTDSISVANGATIVMGGLLQESMQNVDDKTPILGNIPYVGRLFQSKAKAPVKKVVLFMVNVKLLDPTGHPISQR